MNPNEPSTAKDGVGVVDGESRSNLDESKSKRRFYIETIVVAAFIGALTTVVQKLLFGESSIVATVVLTVVMELAYFKFIRRR